MVQVHMSYTAPINPAGASPVLTIPQLWAGLQRKIRHANEFVPVMVGCEVLDETDGVVKRKATFQLGKDDPVQEITETVYSYYPSWIDFEQEDGTHIRNIISDGPGFSLSDLQMTYTFELKIDFPEGSKELAAETERRKGLCKMAVESTIKTIRDMVVDGRIKE